MIQLQSKIRHNKFAFYINQKKVGLYPCGLVFFRAGTLQAVFMIIQILLHQATDGEIPDFIKWHGNDIRIIECRFFVDDNLVEQAMDLPVGQLVLIDP